VAKTHRMPSKSQAIFHKRATIYRALLRKLTCKNKAPYGSLPLCTSHSSCLHESRSFRTHTRPPIPTPTHPHPNANTHAYTHTHEHTHTHTGRHSVKELCIEHKKEILCVCTRATDRLKTHCNTLQHTAPHCNTLQHTATHCNTLQHTATH